MTPVEALTCAALASAWPWNPELGSGGLEDDACVFANFDVAGRLDATLPDPGIQTRALMQRSRVELGVATRHNVLGRLAIDGRQSAPDTGYLGLEGESIYVRVQIAEGRYVLPKLGLSVSGGLIDDPWLITGNQSFTYRPVAPVLVERQGWSDRSDFGGAITWTAPRRVVAATASLLSGEGLQRRERNNGKDVHLLVELRPLSLVDEELQEALVVTGYGKNGSRGTLSARNHRAGARIHGRYSHWGYGGAITKAWGVDGDTERTPWGAELWGTADISLLTAVARMELVDQQPGREETTDVAFLGAVGIRPQDGPGRPAHLLVGIDRQQLGAQSTSIAGGAGTETSTTIFAQVGVNLIGAAPLRLQAP